MKTPREKYYNDPEYAALVKSMVSYIHQCKYTPSELREAAVLASILYYERQAHHTIILSKEEAEALTTLDKWVDSESLG